jgi:hypothetical protein
LVAGGHGLRARRGQIHDRQAAVSQSDVVFEEESFPVWSTMGQGTGHANKQVAVDGTIRLRVMKYACNPAHGFTYQ